MYTDTVVSGDASTYLLYYQYFNTLSCEIDSTGSNYIMDQVGSHSHPLPQPTPSSYSLFALTLLPSCMTGPFDECEEYVTGGIIRRQIKSKVIDIAGIAPSPTYSPTSSAPDIVAQNILTVTITFDMVVKLARIYLGAYVCYFVSIYVIIYLVAFSRVGSRKVNLLYESAFLSSIYKKCAKEVVPHPENSAISDLLQGIYIKNKEVQEALELDEQMNQKKVASNNATDLDDVEKDSRGSARMSSSKSGSLRRSSINSRLLRMMMKNKEKFSYSFQVYLQQQRCLLGCTAALFPQGYSLTVCGCTVSFQPTWLENAILYLCINHAFFNCFYYVKGSKLGRHGTKLIYICRDVLVFVLSQFFSTLVAYLSVSNSGIQFFFNILIVAPLAYSVQRVLVVLYTCPCTESAYFQSNFSRILGYVLLLGRIAVIPILVMIFGALVAACILTTSPNIALILVSYAFNVQLYGILQRMCSCALSFVDDYYVELRVFSALVGSIGGVYLEKIVLSNLISGVDFTVNCRSYVCGLVTIRTITPGCKVESTDHPAVEMQSTQSALHVASSSESAAADQDAGDELSYDMYTNKALDANDAIAFVDEEEMSSLRASLHEFNALRSSLSTRMSLGSPAADAADPKPVEEVRRSIGRASDAEERPMITRESSMKLSQVVISEAKMDVDSMSLADLLEQYRADMAHVEKNADTTDDVDDELFEEWKNSKRKQFKTGTRSSFIKAYNVYEDMFSKNTYTSSKQSTNSSKNEPQKLVTTTNNPMLQAAKGGDSSNIRGSVSSAENTRRLFTQQNVKGNLLDKRSNKRNI